MKWIMVLSVISLFIGLVIMSRFALYKKISKDEYITLMEVLPGAEIISESEGILEYRGKKFIVGLDNLKKKKEYIEMLRLDTLEGYKIIDLRYRRQIIVRKDDF
ncbi:MAG: hypothetical protein ABIL39_06390 [candidate division WOR-3 bacterium]